MMAWLHLHGPLQPRATNSLAGRDVTVVAGTAVSSPAQPGDNEIMMSQRVSCFLTNKKYLHFKTGIQSIETGENWKLF